MIHVAQAGEAKGRVVLHLCSGEANPVALEAAIWIARAFQSEIEGLFVEDEQLVQLASFPLAREISLSGRQTRALSVRDIERHFRFARSAFQAQIAQRALAAEVPFRPRVVRDDPLHAIEVACAEVGPWNIVALAASFNVPSFPSLRRLIETVTGTTGLLIVGPATRRIGGPIVLAVERVEQLPAMLSAAERLAAVADAEITVCLVAESEDELAEAEPAARLVLADKPHIGGLYAVVTHGAPERAAERLRRLAPGIILGQYGGFLVSYEGNLKPLASWLECPLLIMRASDLKPRDEDADDVDVEIV